MESENALRQVHSADLVVSTETLRNWIRAADRRRNVARAAPSPTPQPGGDAVQAELAVVRRRIRELEEERDILRKAARHFAGVPRW